MSKESKAFQKSRFEKEFCRGFNIGTSIAKEATPELKGSAKELLHQIILSHSPSTIFKGIFAGFSFQLETERKLKRIKEIQRINANVQNRSPDRSR